MADKFKTVTVPLSQPVTHDGIEYTALTFRRMKAKDALVAEEEKNQIMAGYMLFASLADVPVEVILDLDMEDMSAIGEKVAPLMGKSLAAKAMGAAPSE